MYGIAEVYTNPGRLLLIPDCLAGILGRDGSEIGDVGPELDESDLATREGRDSFMFVLEADDENRTEETRGDDSAVVRIGDEGIVPLSGREEGVMPLTGREEGGVESAVLGTWSYLTGTRLDEGLIGGTRSALVIEVAVSVWLILR